MKPLGILAALLILAAPAFVMAEAETSRDGTKQAGQIILAAEGSKDAGAKAGDRPIKRFPKPKKKEAPPKVEDKPKTPVKTVEDEPKLPKPAPSGGDIALVHPDLFGAIATADQETVEAMGQALAAQIEADHEGANQELFGALSRDILGRVAELEQQEAEAAASTTEAPDHDVAVGDCGAGAICTDLAARVDQFAAAQPTVSQDEGGLVTEVGRSMFDSAQTGGGTVQSAAKDSDFFEVEKSREAEKQKQAETAEETVVAETDPNAGARAMDETPYTQGKRWNPHRPMTDVPSPTASETRDDGAPETDSQPTAETDEATAEVEEAAEVEEVAEEEETAEEEEAADEKGATEGEETAEEEEAADEEDAAEEKAAEEEPPIIPKGVRIGFQADALRAAMTAGLSAWDIEERLLNANSPEAVAELASWSTETAADVLLRGRETMALDDVVMISVRALIDGAENYRGRWSEMPDKLRYPGPMRRIHGYIVDRETGDVQIVASPAGKGMPISLDELVVGVNAVWRNGAEPLVSLDPDPDDMHGPHQARVQGVPFDSLFAKVMLDADYEMKFVTLLGRDVPFADYRSILQRLREGGAPADATYNRFWFVPGRPGPGEILTTPDGSAVLFDGAMILQTEQMAATSGMLTGLGKRDPGHEAVATYFSDNMAEFESAFPIFRRLHGVMDVSLMAMLWRITELDLPVLRELAALPVPPTKVRKSYKGIHHEEVVGMYQYVLSGGVSLKQQPSRGALVPVALPGLEALADQFETAPGETGMRISHAALTMTRGTAGGVQQADEALLSAVQLLNSGDTERAYLRAERILEDAPDRTEVLLLRAEAAMELGLYRLAERDLHRSFALTGAEEETRLAFTSLAIREGTLTDFSQIPPADRTVLGAQFVGRAATLLAMRQDFDGALAQSEIAVRLSPDLSQAYGTRGGIRLALGDVAAGTADLDRAIELDPKIAKYHLLRAFTALQQEDFATAAKEAGIGMHLSEGRDLMDYVLIRGISRLCLNNDPAVCDAARESLQRAGKGKPPATEEAEGEKPKARAAPARRDY